MVVMGTVNGGAAGSTAIGGIIGDGNRIGRTETAYRRRARMIIHKQNIVTVVVVATAAHFSVVTVVGTCAVDADVDIISVVVVVVVVVIGSSEETSVCSVGIGIGIGIGQDTAIIVTGQCGAASVTDARESS